MLELSVVALSWRQTAYLPNVHMVDSTNWVHYVFEPLAVACIKSETYMPNSFPAINGTRYRLASHEGGHISAINKAMRAQATKVCVKNTEFLQKVTSSGRKNNLPKVSPAELKRMLGQKQESAQERADEMFLQQNCESIKVEGFSVKNAVFSDMAAPFDKGDRKSVV